MNLLLTSVGRRSYLVDYFKKALEGNGLVHAANNMISAAFPEADRTVLTPLIYDPSYIPFLLDYCADNQIGLLISLFDIDLPVLAAHRDEFAQIGTTVVVSDPWVIDTCNDKWKTCQFLEKNHLPGPASWLTVQEAEQAVLEGAARYPLIVKPRWGMGSLAIYQADDETELEVFYRKSHKDITESYLKYEAGQDLSHCVMIQEQLEGQEYGLDVINDLDGNFQAVIQKKKYSMRSGETDCAETVQEEELENLGRTISGLFCHRGNLDVDVFRTKDGFAVLEINARFGGGYPFSHMAGVDLPKALIRWNGGETVEKELLTPKIGVRSQKDIRLIRL